MLSAIPMARETAAGAPVVVKADPHLEWSVTDNVLSSILRVFIMLSHTVLRLRVSELGTKVKAVGHSGPGWELRTG